MVKYISVLFFVGILFSAPQFVGAAIDEEAAKMLCVSGFVDAREQTIIQAQESFQAKVRSALETRKGALVSAWKITNKVQRTTVIKSAWTNFNNTVKAARTEHKTVTKTAWSKFLSNAKTKCGFSGSAGETSGSDTGRY